MYNDSFGVGPAPSEVIGDTAYFRESIPFEIEYYLEPETTNQQELRIWSSDGSVDNTFYVGPGSAGWEFAGPPALDGGVTIFAQFTDPELGPWLQTDKTEDTAEIDLTFAGLTAGFSRGRQELGNDAESAARSAALSFLNALLTPGYRDILVMQGHTPTQIDLARDALADAVGGQTKMSALFAFDEAMATDTPLGIAALGSSDPGGQFFDAFKSEVPSAMTRGVDSLFEPGETIADVWPKFISYDLADIDLDLVGGAKNALEAYMETGDDDYLTAWLQGQVAIENVGITVPLDFLSQIEGPEGAISFGVRDITFGGDYIAGVTAGIGLSQPVTFGNYQVDVFSAGASWFIDPATGEKDFNFGLSALFSW